MVKHIYLFGLMFSSIALASEPNISHSLTGSGAFGGTRLENQIATCEALLGSDPEVSHYCKHIFHQSVEISSGLQYTPNAIKHGCAQITPVKSALFCFTEIHEVGFWRAELLPEYQAGLASDFAAAWKIVSLEGCADKPNSTAAIDCSIDKKEIIKSLYSAANDIAKITSTAVSVTSLPEVTDDIMALCIETFGGYWVGVENCIKEQQTAKRRLLAR